MALLPKNPREQTMVLVCVISIALAALFYVYVFSPKQVELAALAARVDTLERSNAKSKSELAKGTSDQLTQEAAQYSKDLEIMRQLVPTGNELPSLLEQVSTAARRAGLDLASVEPQPVIEGEQFDTYRYKLSVTGGYHALGEFLTNVGSLTRIVAPTDLALSLAANLNEQAVKLRPPGTAPIDSHFEIETYVIKTATPPRGGKS